MNLFTEMARWLVYIEQFNFDWLHCAGSSHDDADGLSRRPPVNDGGFMVRPNFGSSVSDEDGVASDHIPIPAGEHPVNLQQHNLEIRLVVRLRLQQTEKLDIEALLPRLKPARCCMLSGSFWLSQMLLCIAAGVARTDDLTHVSFWYQLRFVKTT